ncbi:acyl-CoA dehydrogenase [Actinokineospora sp. NBRC 105648]|uniref:acyl-CoA dehydrogenase n=1 Tax=Actinokineospora sp. NBRC 105648 TaxID=3032206 RepID=UPI0024A4ECF9|nr:acyl-CoA dehydrogenase [Actinokineospora sp. NBRC 105648]GLZ36551.1 dehydrogenase [Actinokineospora sp. NBRC 105648]
MRTHAAVAVETADGFRALADSGALSLPAAGRGETARRWAELASFGERSLPIARLAEGHVAAAAILAERGDEIGPGTYWGVWAADPTSLKAAPGPGEWRLTGDRQWCAGAHTCTDALVAAVGPDGPALFHVRTEDPRVQPVADTWPATGMAASDSGTVEFSDAPARLIGPLADHLASPGYWHATMGVAAVWLGGARGVARVLTRLSAPDQHQLAHIGAVDELLATGAAVLDGAARWVDANPAADAEQVARRVRAAVERVAAEVAERVGRATGAGPLCADVEHGMRVADLHVYLRESLAERDLARLGELARGF